METRKIVFIDTEGSSSEPWSLQIALRAGEAFILKKPKDVSFPEDFTFIGHNMMHDLGVLRAMGVCVENLQIGDTMLKAALLCVEPQGLKPLAKRLCGAEQEDYAELVAEAQERLAIEWLTKALEWSGQQAGQGG